MWEVILAKAKVQFPQAVDSVLRIVGLKLVGKLIELPEAWADQRLQTIRDATEARSIFSKAVAQAAAERAVRDPAIVDAVAASMFEEQSRRLFNKAKTFQAALQHMSEKLDATESVRPPEDDWLNAFARFSEDASSEKLQDVYARILAGELTAKGSYSLSTLRVVSELDQVTARIFDDVYKEVVGNFIFKNPKYTRSPHWDNINSLRDAGFISSADSSLHRPPSPTPLANGRSLWMVGEKEFAVLIEYDVNTYSEIPIFNLTRMGQEIGSLLPPPDVEQSLRGLVQWNSNRAGWQKATLVKGDVKEVLFDSGANTISL